MGQPRGPACAMSVLRRETRPTHADPVAERQAGAGRGCAMERAAVSRKPNIGIRELKENLSAVVDSAWEHPCRCTAMARPGSGSSRTKSGPAIRAASTSIRPAIRWPPCASIWTWRCASASRACMRRRCGPCCASRRSRCCGRWRCSCCTDWKPRPRCMSRSPATCYSAGSSACPWTSRSGRRRNLDIRWSACWPAPSLWPSWRNCCSARRWRRSRRLPAFR